MIIFRCPKKQTEDLESKFEEFIKPPSYTDLEVLPILDVIVSVLKPHSYSDKQKNHDKIS